MSKGLSTGSTLLNLGCTLDPDFGFLKGKYFFLVGDSDSGKTFFSMTNLAEATINVDFNNYDFIYDNIEDGMLMNLDVLFNEQVADRIRPPAWAGETPVFSHTVESFYFHLDDAFARAGWDTKTNSYKPTKESKPFIYILDSQDGLDSVAAMKKFAQYKAEYRKKMAKLRGESSEEKAKDVAGSYGDGKAKKHSENLRKVMTPLRETGSILIIISQTRDNPAGYAKTRSGGHALAFYATLQIWTSVVRKIWKTVNDKERDVGTRVRVDIRRNRITGKRATVEVDFYPSFGIDDLGSCVDYLVEEKFWKQAEGKQIIDAVGMGMKATRDKLIRMIEKRNLEPKLRELCKKCWDEVDAACALPRKNRYATVDSNIDSD